MQEGQDRRRSRRITQGLFVGGFITFVHLYCVQPLLPEFSARFHVQPAAASLTLSLSTIALAASMLVFGSLSEITGRKSVMVWSLVASSLLMVFTGFAGSFSMLLLFRLAEGVALAGLPSVAMAYLVDEVDPSILGAGMGLYIAGNGLGGMTGRVLGGVLTDYTSWPETVVILGVAGLAGAAWFAWWLPRSDSRHRHGGGLGDLLAALRGHLRDGPLLALCLVAFCLMAAFVTLFNYLAYDLMAPPYGLSQSQVGFLFLAYLFGVVGSSLMGRLSDRFGRRWILLASVLTMATGALTTLSPLLTVKLVGLALVTFGFFGAHSISSGWVGRQARSHRGQASSLYLIAYYLGASLGGTVGGFFLVGWGWGGVTGFVVALLLYPLGLALFPPRGLVGMNVRGRHDHSYG